MGKEIKYFSVTHIKICIDSGMSEEVLKMFGKEINMWLINYILLFVDIFDVFSFVLEIKNE